MRLVRVRRHVRLIDGALREIPAHWRRIAAFPRPFSDDTECGLPCPDQQGMTLLDYFAAHAPIGFADANEAFYRASLRNPTTRELLHTLANLRARYAEEMLKAIQHAKARGPHA